MVHIVTRGESVYQISRYYGIAPEEIIRNNGLSYPYQLTPGQALFLGEEQKIGSLYVNGYVYPFIQREVLNTAIPALSSLTIFGYGFTREGNLVKIDDTELLRIAKEKQLTPIFLFSSVSEDGNFSSSNASYLFQNEWLQELILEQILSIMLENGY